jgi:acetyl esterase/lipase
VYLSPRASVPPVVLFLHGGGWRVGSRHSVGPAFAGISPSPFERPAPRGLAVASADYRLSGEARWPAQLHDAKAAVRRLRARAADLRVDGSRIGAWAESAGGHLAAMLGLTGPDLDGAVGVLGPPSTGSAVVAWYAPTDPVTHAGDTGADAMAADSARPSYSVRPDPRCRSSRPRRAPSRPRARPRRRSCCCTAATTAPFPATRASGSATCAGGPAARGVRRLRRR